VVDDSACVKALSSKILIKGPNSAWALSHSAINRVTTGGGRLSLKALTLMKAAILNAPLLYEESTIIRRAPLTVITFSKTLDFERQSHMILHHVEGLLWVDTVEKLGK
jgi:hypothetical protein